MRVKDISFLKTVFLDPHNHQGIGNLIQVEIHHIQIILVNRSIDHVYHLKNQITIYRIKVVLEFFREIIRRLIFLNVL